MEKGLLVNILVYAYGSIYVCMYYMFHYLLQTWADLKSRTKKKIASNHKSLLETGGGLYRFSNLTELEEVIDRTLLLSSAVAPSGKCIGSKRHNIAPQPQSLDDLFVAILDTPPRTSKAVAVITPNRQQTTTNIVEHDFNSGPNKQLQSPLRHRKNGPTYHGDSGADEPQCSSTKKRRTTAEEQVLLIRRQLRVAEENATSAREQSEALNRLADAAEAQAEAANRSADAAEAQAASVKKMEETTLRIEKMFAKFSNQ